MPRGPVSGFAQAADFYDSVGIGHHPEYFYYVTGGPGGNWDSTAISRLQELGIRHVRLGMYSPANYGAEQFYTGSGRFGVAVKDANASRAGGVQPISCLWGTTEEPAFEAVRGSAVYTITNANGTFLRPLDGPTGTYPSQVFGPSDAPFATYPIKDNFSRGDGALGSNWTNDPFGESTPAAALLNQEWQAGTGGKSTMYWSAASYTGHVEAYATLKNKATTGGSYLRCGIVSTPGASTTDGYLLVIATDTNQWTLVRYDDGVPTTIAGPVTNAINAPWDRFGIDVKNGVVSAYRSDQGYYTTVLSVSDSTYSFVGGGARILIGSNDSGRLHRMRDVGGGDTALLQNFGIYYNQGWITAGGLQGPNEPNAHGAYYGSIRAVLHAFKQAVAARTGEQVLGGGDYIDSTTGRITTGPAHAPQLPVFGFHLTANEWALAGDYKDGTDIDVAVLHIYWGGHGPSYVEASGSGMWGGMAGNFTGLPRAVTETGYYQRDGYDGGLASDGLHPGWNRSPDADHYDAVRYVPPEVAGEYMLRTLIMNYADLGCRRTYLYKLTDEEPNQVIPPWVFGICDTGFVRRASFYAVKNLLALVGFRQAAVNTPLTITDNFTPGSPIDFDPSTPGSYNMEDHMGYVCLQTTNSEFLLLIYRTRDIWARNQQAYQTVAAPDRKNVTFTVAGHNVLTAAIAEPSKISVQAAANGQTLTDPTDGVSYPNPGDGLAYSSITPSGNTFTVPNVAGLVRVVKFTI